MALFLDGMTCLFCRLPMTSRQDIIGFTAVFSRNPLVRPLDDSVCHRACLSRWEYRDEFVRAWNTEARYRLGTSWFLEVTRSGRVQYLTWLGRILYRRGWKRSPLLPELIRPDRPLLLLRPCRGTWPLRVVYGEYHGEDLPPDRIGLSEECVAVVQTWAGWFEGMCGRHCGTEEWEQFHTEGYRLWELLKQEVGGRFRIVYLNGGYIFEPETRN